MGNATEWYDYSVFTAGMVTTAVGTHFFPGEGTNALLYSLMTLAAGFIVRPFGGLFWGPLGDKLGRRRVLSITIVLMAGCTGLVGALPSYSSDGYSVGILAPILLLLLRLIQGFSTGGEYGGAATFIAEYAPTKRRGFWGSFLEFGTLTGYVLGQIVVFAMLGIVGKDAMLDWGWRIPFFVSVPLGLIGLYLRSRLEDTPEFRRLEAAGQRSEKAPLREIFQNNWRMLVKLFCIVFMLNIADYLLLTYMPSYMQDHLGFSADGSSWVIIIVELCQMAVIGFIGAFSDRIGRRPILITAAIGLVVLSYPAFWLMQQKSMLLLGVGFGILGLLLVLILAVIGSTFPAMFPTRVRYGAFAISYNVSTAVFAGTAPLLVEALIKATGVNEIPAFYIMLSALVALPAILFMPETKGVPMDKINNEGQLDSELNPAGSK